jgi:serine/threonine-protein kinase
MADAGGRLPEETALEIARLVGEGLKYAHGMGLLHRDLKPDNILLTVEGVAKLADLGISQNIAKSAQASAGEHFWASPAYVAPEIVLGNAVDARSDIYSLGATLFELLTAQPPYSGATPQETMRMQVEAPLPDILQLRPDLSAQTAALIKRMLAKDPAQRIPNAATLVDAATRLLALKTQSAEPAPPAPASRAPPPAPPAPPPSRRAPKTATPLRPPPASASGQSPAASRSGVMSAPPEPARSVASSARMPAAKSGVAQAAPSPSNKSSKQMPAAKSGTMRRPVFPARQPRPEASREEADEPEDLLEPPPPAPPPARRAASKPSGPGQKPGRQR